MNAPRACWSVLAQKAQDQVSLVQADMAQGRARLLSLQASRERLQKLYEGQFAIWQPFSRPDFVTRFISSPSSSNAISGICIVFLFFLLLLLSTFVVRRVTQGQAS